CCDVELASEWARDELMARLDDPDFARKIGPRKRLLAAELILRYKKKLTGQDCQGIQECLNDELVKLALIRKEPWVPKLCEIIASYVWETRMDTKTGVAVCKRMMGSDVLIRLREGKLSGANASEK